MRRRAIAAALAALALSAFVAPAAARETPSAWQLYTATAQLNDRLALLGQGASTLGLPRKRVVLELRFENRDGYTIEVVAFGQTVVLGVTRARAHTVRGRHGGRRKVRELVSSVAYLAHGKVTPTSIAASFGARGRIAVRFRPSGRALHSTRKAGCKKPSDAIIADLGVFAGELRFQGEGGFTSADIHRVAGRSVDVVALVRCLFGVTPKRRSVLPPPSPPLGIGLPGLVAARGTAPDAPGVPTQPSGGPKTTTLVANSKAPLARIVFAAQARGKGRVRFLAADETSEGSLGILRLVYARGARPGFSANDTLSHATVTPPPPFKGTGVFEHGAGNQKGWSGPLSVSFLGAPRVPLTGPPFGAWLLRDF
jgi:hypothetical protein